VCCSFFLSFFDDASFPFSTECLAFIFFPHHFLSEELGSSGSTEEYVPRLQLVNLLLVDAFTHQVVITTIYMVNKISFHRGILRSEMPWMDGRKKKKKKENIHVSYDRTNW